MDQAALLHDPNWPDLHEDAGWGFDVSGFAGVAMPGSSDTQAAHALAGALGRVRWNFLQLGGSYEITDANQEQWRAIGGFGGVWLPFHHWLDLEAAAGLALRSYQSSDPKFGASGFEVSNPALTFRVGASGRTADSMVAMRVGGGLFAALDLQRESVPWTYEFGPESSRRTITGEQPIGGFTFGLMVNVGFDVEFDRRAPEIAD